jgi:hypothetical protein
LTSLSARDEHFGATKPVALTSLSSVSIFGVEIAGVVELVDALASGASERKLVGVRVPPSAHKKERRVCLLRRAVSASGLEI